MYVVTMAAGDDDGRLDLRAFSEHATARSCFDRFAGYVGKGGLWRMGLYRVADAADPNDAIAAIRNKQKDRIEIIAVKKRSGSRWIEDIDFPAFDELFLRYWSVPNA